MRAIGVIPCRLDSKRFPRKALALIQGKPLIQHVYERTVKSSVLDEVVIATDSKEIYSSAIGFGASVVTTPKEYPSGSDRIAHAVSSLDCEIVVNIQGDQPFLNHQVIDETVQRLFAQPELVMTTPIYPLNESSDINNPNVVKVVIDKQGFALYFSRSPIPFIRNKADDMQILYKHIGIYAYRKDFLDKYTKLGQSSLEIAEGLEQLRVLENGYRIMTVQAIYDSPSVDSEEDLRLLEGAGRNPR